MKITLNKVILLCLLGCSLALRAEEPWSVSQKHPVTSEVFVKVKPSPPQPLEFSEMIFLFYSRYISPIDGQTCHYLPTCSAYGAKAMQEYGTLLGMLMASDRLIRCHPGQQEHIIDPPHVY